MIPCEWKATIDVSAVIQVWLEFWKRTLFGRTGSPELDELALEALAHDYLFKSEPGSIPPAVFTHYYTGTFVADNLEPAINVMLQLSMQARFKLLVNPKRGLCTCVIGTSRDGSIVVPHYFRDVREITKAQFEAVDRGKLIAPKRLKRFRLPQALGIEPLVVLPTTVPQTEGDVQLGNTLSPITGEPVALAAVTKDALIRQTFVAGSTGAGKTNFILNLIDQSAAPALVFDIKREYRCLQKKGATVYGFRGDNVFSHNFLKPEGSPHVWLKELASILEQVIFRDGAGGAKAMVIEEVDRLYKERGCYEGSGNWPHIGDLAAALEARSADTRSEREKGWIASALRVLKSLTIGTTQRSFCVRDGIGLSRLFSGTTVIELDGIGDRAAEALLVSVLLQKLRHILLDQTDRDKLKLLVVLEEAQNILARDAEATSVVTATCREIRALGVGLVYATQMPSQFSRHALANVNTIVCMRLVAPEDRMVMASVLGLPPSLLPMLGTLDVGVGFLKTNELSLIRVPHVPRPVVRDGELPATRVEREEVATSFAARGRVQRKTEDLNPRQWATLLSIAEGRAVYQEAIKTELKYAGKEVGEHTSRLLLRGLIGYTRAKKEGVGRPRSVFFLMPDGEEAYRAQKGRYADRATGESPKHIELLEETVRRLGVRRKPHPRFDLLFDEEGVDRAVEVETGSNNNAGLRTNLEKNLAAFGEARFAVADERTYNRVLQVAARHAFDERKGFTIRLATVAALPRWDVFTLEAVSSPSE